MIGRLVHTADFQRLLATPPRSRSAHFAVHHVGTCPSGPIKPKCAAAKGKLSTPLPSSGNDIVDKFFEGHWLGSVVPKRHAKSSVTRNALKRQMRQAMARNVCSLPAGLWLIRLKASYARSSFRSATSRPLCESAAAELDAMLQRSVA